MATILFLSGDVPSRLWAGIELCRRLSAAGHRAVVGGPAAGRRAAERNGLEFFELAPSGYEAFLTADAATGWWRRLRRVEARRRAAIESLRLAELAGTLRRFDSDLLIIDCELHEQIAVAWSLGVPIAQFSNFISILRRPGLPPPHRLARPGVGVWGSALGCRLLWRDLRLRKWLRAWRLRLSRAGCDRLSILRQLARERDFDLSRETDPDQWLKPFTWRRPPVLNAGALELDFPHRPSARSHHLGPLTLADRGEVAPEAVDTRARLEPIYRRVRETGRRLIYAGFGSYLSASRGLLRRIAEAVAAREDWELVLSLGGRMSPEELGPPAERVHVFRWVPQLEVLEHADVAVFHGGTTTVDECILAGVPMLVYCGFATDMAGNTARIVHHGLGIAGRRDDPAATITKHLERLLSERGFRRSLERLGTAFRAYERDRVAVRVVESLLEATAGESEA